MKDKAMTERKIQQNNLAVITPAAFYTNEEVLPLAFDKQPDPIRMSISETLFILTKPAF